MYRYDDYLVKHLESVKTRTRLSCFAKRYESTLIQLLPLISEIQLTNEIFML